MVSKQDSNKARLRRHKRVRGKISGTAERPRLNVFRSNASISMPKLSTTPQAPPCAPRPPWTRALTATAATKRLPAKWAS